jgi:recombination protein RecA
MPHPFAQPSLFTNTPPPGAEYEPAAGAFLTRWSFTALAGRVVELSGIGASAPLTCACSLILDAQEQGESVAWITQSTSHFFPSDVIEHGIDLAALALVRVPDMASSVRTADLLTRSGAFGVVVVDLGRDLGVPLAPQARLVQLARLHATVILCLTEKATRSPSLSSLVSLRVETQRQYVGPDRFRCVLRAVKDKRDGPGWSIVNEYCGPVGLR